MKPRTILTTPVLAVVALSHAACSRTVEAPSSPRPEAASPPSPAAIDSAIARASEPSTSAKPAPAPGADEDPALRAMREELLNSGRVKALAAIEHFRPLCDKDGYPLVGNVLRKSPHAEYQPSQLCAEVRKAR